jgi:hypothetical protein
VVKIAEEAYIVAYDIQEAGSGTRTEKIQEKLGTAKETTIGLDTVEGAGSSLAAQGIFGIGTCKLVEVKSNSAAEAIAVVREKYLNNGGPARAVVKPNTNFKTVV